MRNKLVEQGLKVKDAELRYIANTPIEIADMETAQKLMKMIDALTIWMRCECSYKCRYHSGIKLSL